MVDGWVADSEVDAYGSVDDDDDDDGNGVVINYGVNNYTILKRYFQGFAKQIIQ